MKIIDSFFIFIFWIFHWIYLSSGIILSTNSQIISSISSLHFTQQPLPLGCTPRLSLPPSHLLPLQSWTSVIESLGYINSSDSSNCPNFTFIYEFASSLLQFCRSQKKKPLQIDEEVEIARYTIQLSSISFISGIDFSECSIISVAFCLPVNEHKPCDPSIWWGNVSTLSLPLVIAHVTTVSELSTYVFSGLHFPTRRYIERLLETGLDATTPLWHVTGLPAPHIDSVIPTSSLVPQYSFYFSSSYRSLRFEKAFKQMLHERTAFFYSRAPVVGSNADLIMTENEKDPSKQILPIFSLPSEKCLNKTNILVIDSFWMRGFASHRVTRPLVNAMMLIHCVTLLYGVQGNFNNFTEVAQASAADDVELEDGKFVEAFRIAVWDEKLTGRDWRLALAKTIQKRKFNVVYFTSVGMTSFDTVLASFPLSKVQSLAVGHPSSTGSSSMTHFFTGTVPEVLGPLSSSILDPFKTCDYYLSELEEELQGHCLEDVENINKNSIEIRMPFTAFCTQNSSHIRLCKRYRQQSVYKARKEPHCRGINSESLWQRLVDAQKRYTEQLVLAPGIGMGLTSVVTTVGQKVRRQVPKLSVMAIEQLTKAAHALHTIGTDALIESLCETGFESDWSIGSTTETPLKVALTWSNPKWNQEHLQRLFSSLRLAQKRHSQMYLRCLTMKYQLEKKNLQMPPCSLCQKMLSQSSHALYIQLLLFVPMDGLRASAMQLLLTRQIEESVPYTSIKHIFNAGHMGEYLRALGESDIGFDSQPFSGGNTLHDFLALSIPVLSLSHDGRFDNGTSTPLRWRSALGASILTVSKLSGLVAIDDQEQALKFSILATNPYLRDLWRIRISNIIPHEAIQQEWQASCYAKMMSLL
jgi:hypothetical protein